MQGSNKNNPFFATDFYILAECNLCHIMKHTGTRMSHQASALAAKYNFSVLVIDPIAIVLVCYFSQIFDSEFKHLRTIRCHGDNGDIFQPYDVIIDKDDNIITLEREKGKLRIHDSRGHVITEFGSVGTGDGQFINPSYVTVNESGHIIVSDLGNDRIQVFTNTGQFLFKFGQRGQGNGEFGWPTGIAVKGNGDIIVADSCNNRIQIFRADGCFVSCLGALECSTGDRVKSPQGLTVDENDDIYVADWGNNRIQIY